MQDKDTKVSVYRGIECIDIRIKGAVATAPYGLVL